MKIAVAGTGLALLAVLGTANLALAVEEDEKAISR